MMHASFITDNMPVVTGENLLIIYDSPEYSIGKW